MTMNYHDEAIRRLSTGFSSEFAEFCAGDERMHDIMMTLADEFVEQNIPIVKEEDATDVAVELIMGVTVTTV